MTTYLVTWEIEVDAESAREAAEIAHVLIWAKANAGSLWRVWRALNE